MLTTRKFPPVKALKNAELGKRLFILANGPSILQEPLELLHGEIVIGMNASILLDQKHGFFSRYYVVSDVRFLSHSVKREFATTALHPDTQRVFRSELRVIDEPGYQERTHYIRSLGRDGFSQNLAAGFYFGCTTTLLGLQLAHYLGASSIHLLGCDLKYPAENPRFYAEDRPQIEDSFTSIQIWNIVNAFRILRDKGIKVTNCSSSSFLRPYVGFQSFQSIFQ